MGDVVVGIDGSAAAHAALRFALDEARMRGCRLVAMHAFDLPAFVDAPHALVPTLLDDLRTASADLLDEAFETVGGVGDVEVERRTAQGLPARALVEASKGAELLVIGSRGRGGFAGLLLGSVSQQCAHHAHCPIAIVHAPEGDNGSRDAG